MKRVKTFEGADVGYGTGSSVVLSPVTRAACCDIDAVMERFEEIYTAHRQEVEAYVRRRAPADLVEDVVADVFVVCLRRIDDVPRTPLPWLYAVARKTLANERRRSSRLAPSEIALARDPEPTGDAALATAFAGLNDNDREILRLVAWEGLTPSQAAAVLDCSRVAARVRYHRAKQRLAARLDETPSVQPIQQGALR
jgi:RNA polymerase sigma-70 factor, ECF subfamily